MDGSSELFSSSSEPSEPTPNELGTICTEVARNLTTNAFSSVRKSPDETTKNAMFTEIRRIDRPVRSIREMGTGTLSSVIREFNMSTLRRNTNATNKIEEPTLTELLVTFIKLPL